MTKKILIMGLPGSGKSTLAAALSARLAAPVFSGDALRQEVNKDLGFSHEDRVEQARRAGWLCDQVCKAGGYAIADLVCPTDDCRAAFAEGGEDYTIWCDGIAQGRFADTNEMFVTPFLYDLRVDFGDTSSAWVELAWRALRPQWDPHAATALLIGRFQPFHAGHKALAEKGLFRSGQVLFGVRGVPGDLLCYDEVRSRIEDGMAEHRGHFAIQALPNIDRLLYGRDVGYVIERVGLGEALEAVSGTVLRRDLGLKP